MNGDTAQRLRQVREMFALTQRELSEAAGMEMLQYTRLEGGETLSLPDLLAVSCALGVRLGFITNYPQVQARICTGARVPEELEQKIIAHFELDAYLQEQGL